MTIVAIIVKNDAIFVKKKNFEVYRVINDTTKRTTHWAFSIHLCQNRAMIRRI